MELEDLVGKVLKIDFTIQKMEKVHHGYGDWDHEKRGTYSETITSITLGYSKEKLLLVKEYSLKEEKKSY